MIVVYARGRSRRSTTSRTALSPRDQRISMVAISSGPKMDESVIAVPLEFYREAHENMAPDRNRARKQAAACCPQRYVRPLLPVGLALIARRQPPAPRDAATET